MSLRLEMLQVARLAPDLLGEAREPVAEFLLGQLNEDGGARDLAGRSDLYYTVFTLEGLVALRRDPPAASVRAYLESFGSGEGLDLVHLTCLARCWETLPGERLPAASATRIADRIESYRCRGGGYGPLGGEGGCATVYHGFLALGARQDLGRALADPAGLARSLGALGRGDGAFANRPDVAAVTTPTTAAAVTALRQLGEPVPPATADWLLARARPEGGFLATEDAPMPDLLSTATALHALAGMRVPFTHLKEATLDFLDTLWTGRGFCGNWAADAPDAEYTFYALLSLGHLSLA